MTMKERNVWRYLFVGVGILCLLISAILISRMRLDHKNAELRQQYLELRKSYLTLAKDYKRDLNILAKNEAIVAKSWAQEHELPEASFGEAVRRKIVRLEIECEVLENQGTNVTPTSGK